MVAPARLTTTSPVTTKLLGIFVLGAAVSVALGVYGDSHTPTHLAGVVTRDFPNETDQINVVTKGKGPMPAFGGTLTASQIRQVVDYTRTGLGK